MTALPALLILALFFAAITPLALRVFESFCADIQRDLDGHS